MKGQIQVFSSYSLLESPNRCQELVKKAKSLGYEALALTDLNTMAGVLAFEKICHAENIKPLFGITLQYMNSEIREAPFELVLLAKNLAGYRQLMKISSYKMENETRVLPTLSEYQEFFQDLVVITGGSHGELEFLIEENRETEAQQVLLNWQTLFQNHCDLYGACLYNEPTYEEKWQAFLESQELKGIAMHPVRYLHAEDLFAYDVLHHIQQGTTLQLGKEVPKGQDFLIDAEAFQRRYVENGNQKALVHLSNVLATCQVEIPVNQQLQPHFPVPENTSAAEYLQKQCLEALPLRVAVVSKVYEERLAEELSVIHTMGFDDYFLIVWDVTSFAHRENIVVGAGRGSAAGSLVSYVLGITDVDPIQYNLLFERFLNKERYTMPDIDLDIPDNRREEVLQYVAKKYGYHHVAQIATFGTLAAKQALRDVARVFGLSQSESNKWSAAIPNELKITLSEAYEKSGKLQKLVKDNPRNTKLFEIAEKLEGLPRHTSTHAAGVVICDEELTDYVPLQSGSGGIEITQFTMGDVEAIGLLKMDFLGLRNLSIIDETLKNVKRLTGETIVLNQIPLNDEATFQLFQKGETTGIFQFESAGIRNVLRKLGPESLEDLAAVNALYRPGPMENIDLFIQRKKGLVAIEYPHDNLREILDVTYGIIVYQEQIMQVASKMAGFSLGQADILRRAISKKKKEVLDEERNHFVTGAVAAGYDEKVANEVYHYIERFANYGFNRSHAVAYSMIGYQMAYLKVHYPAAFFGALLNSVRHDAKKIKEYVVEGKRYGIRVSPPNINRSYYGFTLFKEELLFGFSSLKGIRRDFIKNIIEDRGVSGPFQSIDDFLMRIEKKWRKSANIEPLIYVGAFDSLNHNRRQLIADLESKIKNIEISGGSMDLLEMLELKPQQLSDYTLEQRLDYEVQYLGTYLSGHPTEDFPVTHKRKKVRLISDIAVGEKVNLLVTIKSIREITTKKGDFMAFAHVEDASSELDVTIFPELYRQVRRLLSEKKVLFLAGVLETSRYRDQKQLLAEQLVLAEELEATLSLPTVFLQVTAENDNTVNLEKLRQILKDSPGNSPVVLYYKAKQKKVSLTSEFSVSVSEKLEEDLKVFLGNENVVFQYYKE